MISRIKSKLPKDNTLLKYFSINILFSLLTFIAFMFTQTYHIKEWQHSFPLLCIKLADSIILLLIVFYASITVFSKPLKGLNKNIKDYKSLSLKDRTKLFLTISKIPSKAFIFTFIFYLVDTVIFTFSIRKIDAARNLLKNKFILTVCFIYFAYIFALILYSYIALTCSKLNEEIFEAGIEKQIIEKKKYFGFSLSLGCIIYIIIPIILCNLYYFVIFYKDFSTFTSKDLIYGLNERSKIVVTALFNSFVLFGSSVIYYRQYKRNISKLQKSAIEFLGGKETSAKAKVSLSNKVQYNIYLLNEIIDRYTFIISKAQDIGGNILNATNSLLKVSEEVSRNSKIQNGIINGFKNTMNDANDLSKNISGMILQVSEGTTATKAEIQIASDILKQNVEQMSYINKSNDLIIEGITKLSEQMKSIDEIAAIINDIAEQTKTVAFNAELEAISATKKDLSNSNNFHIVSTEIKRLADSTADSIHEIQNYIGSIQAASQELLKASDKSTENIHEERQLIIELENQYKSIMKSSDEVNDKTQDILSTVKQQTVSFGEIVNALVQISAGFEQFTASTITIKDNVTSINEVAKKLTYKTSNKGEDKEDIFGDYVSINEFK